MAGRYHASLETLAVRFLSGFAETHCNIVVTFKNSLRRSDQSSFRRFRAHLTRLNSADCVKAGAFFTVAGRDVKSPQEAVGICPNVRGRIWVRALNPSSKYVKAPDNFQRHARGLGSNHPPCTRQRQTLVRHREVVPTRNTVSYSRLLLVVPARRVHGRSTAVLARRYRSTASDQLL